MRSLIGTGTTDANGQVTVTYTGTGAGKVQLMAECGDIQSEIYTLYDCSFYDIGTEENHRTDWTGTATANYNETGTLLSSDTTTTTQFTANYTLPDEFTLEIDIARTGSTTPRMYAHGYDLYLTSTRLPDTNFHSIRGVFADGQVEYFVDDVSIGTFNTTSNTTLRFLVSSTSTLTFRNLKIY